MKCRWIYERPYYDKLVEMYKCINLVLSSRSCHVKPAFNPSDVCLHWILYYHRE